MNKKSGTLILEKRVGQTPLQVLEEFRKENPEYKGIKMAYAGRLDPMAEGKLLVLVGETCKERDKYLGLDKEYEFEILFDFKTDSQDVLGLGEYKKTGNFLSTNFFRRDKHLIPKERKIFDNSFLRRDKHLTPSKRLSEILLSFVGKQKMKYPIFSSKTVQGKPLFLWALEKRIAEIKIPEREVEIYELEYLQEVLVSAKKLKEEIFEKINSLSEVKEKSKELGANFRRKEIRGRWNKIFENIPEEKEFLIMKLRAKCSSGTYMRVLAEKIAQELGQFGLAFSIKRTKFFL